MPRGPRRTLPPPRLPRSQCTTRCCFIPRCVSAASSIAVTDILPAPHWKGSADRTTYPISGLGSDSEHYTLHLAVLDPVFFPSYDIQSSFSTGRVTNPYPRGTVSHSTSAHCRVTPILGRSEAVGSIVWTGTSPATRQRAPILAASPIARSPMPTPASASIPSEPSSETQKNPLRMMAPRGGQMPPRRPCQHVAAFQTRAHPPPFFSPACRPPCGRHAATSRMSVLASSGSHPACRCVRLV